MQFDPDDADSEPSPPLGKATDWVHVELDLGDGLKPYTRDTNVMPQWAGSSWYELRYTDPHNKEELCAKENEAYWMGPRPAEHGPKDPGGVDLYVGGVEHAVLHLLYVRFWHKVLYDLGHVSSREPYRRLVNQGYIQAFAYTDARGAYVPAAEVVERDGKFYWPGPDGEIEVFQEFGKIGKSLKNSVSPDEICDDYGADTLRVYEMSMGPLEASRPWATKDVVGAYRFLQRVWRLVVDERPAPNGPPSTRRSTTRRCGCCTAPSPGCREDYAALRNNTAAAKLIEYTNHLTKEGVTARAARGAAGADGRAAGAAPGRGAVAAAGPRHVAGARPVPAWPTRSTWSRTPSSTRCRSTARSAATITVAADAAADAVEAAALADEKVAAFLDGATPKKVIVVAGQAGQHRRLTLGPLRPAELAAGSTAVVPDLGHVADLVAVEVHDVDVVGFAAALPVAGTGPPSPVWVPRKTPNTATLLRSSSTANDRTSAVPSGSSVHQALHPFGVRLEGGHLIQGVGLRGEGGAGVAVLPAFRPPLTGFAGIEELCRGLRDGSS